MKQKMIIVPRSYKSQSNKFTCKFLASPFTPFVVSCYDTFLLFVKTKKNFYIYCVVFLIDFEKGMYASV